MNTGSQNTAPHGVFSTSNMPCSIPAQPFSSATRADWKAFTFRSAATCLYTLMTEAMEKNALADTLQANINTLQEYFLERVYALLHSKGIDASQKIMLRLDDANTLCICNEHADTTAISHLLNHEPELSALFREMAIQSLALHQMTSLQDLTYAYLTSQEESIGRTRHYHVNIKGDMSHFFFTSPNGR